MAVLAGRLAFPTFSRVKLEIRLEKYTTFIKRLIYFKTKKKSNNDFFYEYRFIFLKQSKYVPHYVLPHYVRLIIAYFLMHHDGNCLT